MLYLKIVGTALATIIIIAGLHYLMPPRWRRSLVAGVTFGAGLFYIIDFILPTKTRFEAWTTSYGAMVAVLGSFALGLAVINLLLVHTKNIIQRRGGWYNSVVLILSMFAMIVIGFWWHYQRENRLIEELYKLFYGYMLLPLGATMFSLLAFFMTSAAFRALRMRTFEAALLMIVGFIVMLGQVPIGKQLTGFLADTSLSALQLPNIKEWIMGVPNMAAQRAINFGAAVGAIAISLRYLLSLERGAFWEQKL